MKEVVGYTASACYECLEDLQKNLIDLNLHYCGWEYCEPGHRYGPNQRECHVIHIVKSGRGILDIGGKRYHLERGNAFTIRKGENAWYMADQTDPWCYFWIGFTGLKAEEYIRKAGFLPQVPVKEVGGVDKLYSYLEQILDAHQLTLANDMRRQGLLMQLFAELIEDYQEKTVEAGNALQKPESVYVKEAMNYFSLNYRKKIRIQEVADYIGVNRSYLTTSFKRVVGCSPQEYLINLRMEKAKSMLTETETMINVIAASVGYTDQLSFSRIFRLRYGMSPRDYREREQKLVIGTKKGDYLCKKH